MSIIFMALYQFSRAYLNFAIKNYLSAIDFAEIAILFKKNFPTIMYAVNFKNNLFQVLKNNYIAISPYA